MKSISEWQIGEVLFRIYRAKNLLNDCWNDLELKDLLLSARHSYGVFGRRALLDGYDSKSAIYIAHALYPEDEEWLSIRLVPGEGEPLGTGELEKFSYQGHSIAYFVKKNLFGGDPNFWRYIFSSSRMCGIHPKNSPKHRFTAYCYALINLHFLEDYLLRSDGRCVTGVIINRFVDHALTVEIDGQKYGTAFIPAYKFLGISDPKKIRYNRKLNKHYVYRFPAYFLNAEQLVAVLQDLIDSGRLSEKTVEAFLKIKISFRELVQASNFTPLGSLRNLGRLLMVRGRIPDSQITGEDLRALLDYSVDDGPELKITEIPLMKKSIEDILAASRAIRIPNKS